MTASQHTIYQILLWAIPVLLAMLGFIGALAVKQLVRLSDSVNEIRIVIARIDEKHTDLERRVTNIEEKIS